jgi:hypothetical protein
MFGRLRFDIDAALSVAPAAPTETVPDRRRRFRVIDGGKAWHGEGPTSEIGVIGEGNSI